jgi:hypothetical protein
MCVCRYASVLQYSRSCAEFDAFASGKIVSKRLTIGMIRPVASTYCLYVCMYACMYVSRRLNTTRPVAITYCMRVCVHVCMYVFMYVGERPWL